MEEPEKASRRDFSSRCAVHTDHNRESPLLDVCLCELEWCTRDQTQICFCDAQYDQYSAPGCVQLEWLLYICYCHKQCHLFPGVTLHILSATSGPNLNSIPASRPERETCPWCPAVSSAVRAIPSFPEDTAVPGTSRRHLLLDLCLVQTLQLSAPRVPDFDHELFEETVFLYRGHLSFRFESKLTRTRGWPGGPGVRSPGLVISDYRNDHRK
ncbi:hypothetical protein RRG08_008479 [Elysia crispata]|uniref:Uncharacterized protein n=1 Tax=Elysia crispata TaxID=231223 RepID=A0AAE0Z840_9GAST|nr:hypothetical protein RRG08_008479 [Elysia crispata]